MARWDGVTAEDRFWAKVEKTKTCWLWTGAIGKGGYGNFYADRRYVRAHRFAYELLVGPIPEGLDIDHVRARGCRHRHCVNPAHLEPVTRQENLLRGATSAAKNAAKTHCPRGHEYTKENTRMRKRAGRECKACHRDRERARYHSKKGK